MTIEEQSYTLGQLLEDLGLVFDKKYQPLYKQILDTFGDNAHITRPIEQSTLPDKEACFKVLRAMPPFVRPAYRPVHELTMMGRVYENLYAPPVASDSGKEQQTVLSEKLLSLLAEPISLAVYEEIKEALPKLNQTATKFNAIVSDIQAKFLPHRRYFEELEKLVAQKKAAEKQIENLEKSRLTFLQSKKEEPPKVFFSNSAPRTIIKHEILSALPESWGNSLGNTPPLLDDFRLLLVTHLKTLNTLSWQKLSFVNKAQLPSVQSYIANRILDRAGQQTSLDMPLAAALTVLGDALTKEEKNLQCEELLAPLSVAEFLELVPAGYFDLGAYLVRYGLHDLLAGGEAIDLARSSFYQDYKKTKETPDNYNATAFDKTVWDVKTWGEFFRRFGLAFDASQPLKVSVARSIFAKEMSSRMLGFKRT